MSEGGHHVTPDPEGREVDCWQTDKGTFIRPPLWRRAKCYPDLTAAVSAVQIEFPYPFILNYRDPAEVPKEEWPITRTTKPKDHSDNG